MCVLDSYMGISKSKGKTINRRAREDVTHGTAHTAIFVLFTSRCPPRFQFNFYYQFNPFNNKKIKKYQLIFYQIMHNGALNFSLNDVPFYALHDVT